MTPLRAHLDSLALCHVECPTFSPARAVSWLGCAAATGWALPLGLAHDLGLLLTAPAGAARVARPEHLPADLDTSAYLDFLQRFAAFPALRDLAARRPSDAVIAVVLARLVEGLALPAIWTVPAGRAASSFLKALTAAVGQTRVDRPGGDALAAGGLLTAPALNRLERNVRALDPDELRFLTHYGAFLAGGPDPRGLIDLLALTNLPEASRLVLRRTYRLLPCVSDGRTRGGAPARPEGGYEDLTLRGSFDSLVPSELAYPDELFFHRVVNREALYYGRDRPRERRRELAYIVIQTGFGLGGDGQVLARALLLALGQMALGRGYEVRYSFAGADLDRPRRLNRPGEVGRILYHHELARADAGKMLRAVLQRLRAWRREYAGRQVLWVLAEHFDMDGVEEHAPLYRALRSEAGQRAWYVRPLGPESDRTRATFRPPTAGCFETWQVMDTRSVV